MQLKRIIITLLVAVMMISMAVLAASAAETEGVSFVIAVENSDSEGNIAVVPGETVEVPVIITNNPGVAYTAFRVRYDESAMDYVSKADGDTYSITTLNNGEGIVYVRTDPDAKVDSDVTGTILTLTFAVDKSFAGEKTSVVIDYVKAYTVNFDSVDAEAVNGEIECPHTNVTILEATEATCKEAGKTEGKQCADCGEILVAQEEIAVLDHTPGAEATCTAAQTCTVCGEELAPIADHTPVAMGTEIPATCTTTGMTAGEKCSVCEKVITAPAVIEMLEHTAEVVPGVAATCGKAGLTEGSKCSVCGTILTAQEEIPATGEHIEETIPAVEATCTATGLTAGKKCSVCGTIIEAQTETEKAAHTEVEIPGIEATCTTAGLTAGKKCSVCNVITLAQETVATKAHTEVVIEAVAATCTAAGSTEGKKCSVCGVVTVAPTVVQPTGHTLEEIPAVEPTYSEAGATAGSKCTVCGEIIDTPDEIPAKSLAWLWVLIVCVVVVGGGATAFYFLFLKKRLAK